MNRRKIAAFTLLATGMFAGSALADVSVLVSATGWISQNDNQQVIDFLADNFEGVTVTYGDFGNTEDSGVQAALAGADVLVIARRLSSGDYDATDDSYYNAGLTIPVVSLTSYVTRDIRMNWESGGVGNGWIDGDETTVTASGAAIFGSAGSVDWWSGTGGFSAPGTGSVGEGNILATLGGNNLVVGWYAGDQGAAGQLFSGNRLLFNLPEISSAGVIPDTAAGRQALIDALEAYTPLVPSAGSTSTNTADLTVIEAESGSLGAQFSINALDGASSITISPSGGGSNPGSTDRVATYSVIFPEANTYQLYARLYVGPNAYDDDSFFYAASFGEKSPTTSSDWIGVNGLASAGFSSSLEEVTTGGGAGTQVWKWVKWATVFTVNAGDLTQTFQVGGREDGLYLDKLVFGPADTALTVQNLDDGTLPLPPTYSTNIFDGPFGIAIHRFDETIQNINRDGAHPVGLSVFGNGLSGVTFSGGSKGEGTVFMMSLDGTNFNTVSSLSSTANAGSPRGGLTVSGSGFYGTSMVGGANNAGAVFAAHTNGTITLLHSFNALSTDKGLNVGGAVPYGSLALSGSTLYGATAYGGASGKGTLFSLSTEGSGFNVLHEFSALDAQSGSNTDGALPCGGMVLDGSTLYGTTSAGGAHGAGIVFSINVNGTGFTPLHDFAALDSLTTTNFGGAFPDCGLVLSNNALYGATQAGGAGGEGTLFVIGTDGSGFAVLHDFSATDPLSAANVDGAAPFGDLLLSGNILYGTASAGGAGAAGTVFSLDITGPEFSTLYSFGPISGSGTNTYGANPLSAVVRVDNALYGTTFGGGPGGEGTVFKLVIPIYAAVSGVLEGNVMIDFSGAPNSTYVVQSSDDLSESPVIWRNLSTNVADGSGRWTFTEQAVLSSNRFYRANSL